MMRLGGGAGAPAGVFGDLRPLRPATVTNTHRTRAPHWCCPPGNTTVTATCGGCAVTGGEWPNKRTRQAPGGEDRKSWPI